jgi:hypothetical protein
LPTLLEGRSKTGPDSTSRRFKSSAASHPNAARSHLTSPTTGIAVGAS